MVRFGDRRGEGMEGKSMSLWVEKALELEKFSASPLSLNSSLEKEQEKEKKLLLIIHLIPIYVRPCIKNFHHIPAMWLVTTQLTSQASVSLEMTVLGLCEN